MIFMFLRELAEPSTKLHVLSSRKDFEVGNPEVSVLNAASMFRFQTDSPASDSHATEIHWNNKKGNSRESICSPIKYGWFLSTST